MCRDGLRSSMVMIPLSLMFLRSTSGSHTPSALVAYQMVTTLDRLRICTLHLAKRCLFNPLPCTLRHGPYTPFKSWRSATHSTVSGVMQGQQLCPEFPCCSFPCLSNMNRATPHLTGPNGYPTPVYRRCRAAGHRARRHQSSNLGSTSILAIACHPRTFLNLSIIFSLSIPRLLKISLIASRERFPEASECLASWYNSLVAL